MSSAARVTIHPSQFPDQLRRQLLESLRARQVNHKFLYDGARQTRKWLALHQAHSPSRNDPDCAATYDRSFAAVSAKISAPHVHLVGLGCGGGQKDTRLLDLLQSQGKALSYTPCDVSVAMVLVARQAALAVVSDDQCFPLVCDLAMTDELPELIQRQSPGDGARLITFFGMIPNFEPQAILPKLGALLRPDDFLLFSANLAPGADYDAGLRRVLPQYDNDLTRDWLMTFLLELGVEPGDGELRFTIEDVSTHSGLKRIVARFHFAGMRRLEVEGEPLEFRTGDVLRLCFSCRYTPGLLRPILDGYHLQVLDQWITQSMEEGVFLCRRQ